LTNHHNRLLLLTLDCDWSISYGLRLYCRRTGFKFQCLLYDTTIRTLSRSLILDFFLLRLQHRILLIWLLTITRAYSGIPEYYREESMLLYVLWCYSRTSRSNAHAPWNLVLFLLQGTRNYRNVSRESRDEYLRCVASSFGMYSYLYAYLHFFINYIEFPSFYLCERSSRIKG